MKVKEVTTNTEINLSKSNFVASGGEGSIYRIKNKCYKVYIDPAKMLPLGKIKELSQLHSNNIINPISLLEGAVGNFVGYSMNFVDDCLTLCNIFPMSFKQRNNIKTDNINKLVEIMKQIVKEFHKNKMLIVDMNEYNFLIKDKLFDNLYLIDVDSCQTPSYKATAIMESIKDFHAKSFNEMSDWFSFAVLTFQMYTGLHPFKGKHSSITNFVDRMKNNLSVYDKNVSVPAFIKNFESLIPKNFNDWYKIIFSSDKRDFPPDSFEGVIIQVLQKIIQKQVKFIVDLIQEFTEGNIISVRNDLTLTDKGLYINKAFYSDVASYSKFIVYKKEAKVYSFIIKNKEILARDIRENKDIKSNIYAEHLIEPSKNYKINSEILYSINNSTLFTIKVHSKYESIQIDKLVDLANSYQVFNNVIIQPVLDSIYIILLRGFEKVLEVVKIEELAKQRIVNAESNNNILVGSINLFSSFKNSIFSFCLATVKNIFPAFASFCFLLPISII